MVNEIAPSALRGTVNVCVSAFSHLGTALAGIIGLFFQTRLADDQDSQTWRILFIVSILLLPPIIYLRNYLPESPRWLIGKNKPTEAEVIIDLI